MAARRQQARLGARGPRLLHICAGCKGGLVQPVEWNEFGRETWAVTLFCPDCEREETGVFSQAECDLYDEYLEDGLHRLAVHAEQVTGALMAEWVKAFARALEADAVQPIDF